MRTNKKIVYVFSVILIISLFTTYTVLADNRTSDNNQSTTVQNEEIITEDLCKLSFAELVSKINFSSEQADSEGSIYFAEALKNKAKDISEKVILDEIMDSSNSTMLRVLLIQLCPVLGVEIDYDGLETLLDQEDVDFEIKRNILINLSESSSDLTALEEAALGGDERLAFQALKLLNFADPEKAGKIAVDILESFSGDVTYKVRAAIKVKALHLQTESTEKERADFISLCDSILCGNKSNDSTVTDTVIFALSDMLSEESISYIINSDKIDSAAKVFCVNENYSTLKDMLGSEATEEEIETVLHAMKIFPIAEMEEPLRNLIDKKSQIASTNDRVNITSELEDRINEIIDFIALNGEAVVEYK